MDRPLRSAAGFVERTSAALGHRAAAKGLIPACYDGYVHLDFDDALRRAK